MKRVLLFAALLFGTILPSLAQSTGTCGTNLTWTLRYSTLIIEPTEGTTGGAMTNYSSYSNVPWYSNRSKIEKIEIKEGVTGIGNYAFYGCSNVDGVITLPSGLTSIGTYAFYNCSGITNVEFPNTLTTINSYAFSGCSGITELTIPENVTSIYYKAFERCSGLQTLYYNARSCSLSYSNYSDDRAFCNLSSIKKLVFGENVSSLTEFAFYGCSGIEEVVIPQKLTSIPNYCFYGCRGITNLVFPNTLKTIGSYAFSGCSGITELTIPENVTSIYYKAFERCSGLQTLYYNARSCSLSYSNYTDDRAFCNLSSIKKLVLGENVASLSEYAFYGCTGLKTVIAPPPTAPTTNNNCFGNITLSNVKLEILCGAWASYAANSTWNQFDIDEGCRTITFYPRNGIDSPYKITGSKNLLIPAQDTPTHADNMLFGGWYTDSIYWYGYNKWNFEEDKVMDSMSLFALWAATDNYHIVTYDFNDGITPVYRDTVPHNFKTYMEEPSRRGYMFGGWYSEDDDWYGFDFNQPITEDITLTASWYIYNYDIGYVLNGGENSSENPSRYNVTSPEIVLAAPTRPGYEFKGWKEGDTVFNDTIKAGSIGDRTFVAYWELINYTITYANVQEGENPTANPSQYTIESPTIVLREPVRKGYTGSWKEGNTILHGSTGNKTFTAQWVQNTLNGVELQEITNVGTTYATMRGFVSGTGSVKHGVVIAAKERPSLKDVNARVGIASSMATGEFTITVYGLQSNMSYFARTFAILDNDTLYSTPVFFSTWANNVDSYTVDILGASLQRPSFVDILVQVTNSGSGVDYLRDKDFNILEDDEAKQSTEIHKYVRPMEEIPFDINTMLVLDYTSSLETGTLDGFNKIKAAASNLVRNKMPNQKFGLIIFRKTNPEILISEFTDDTAYIIEKINSIEDAGDRTSLFDAYKMGIDLMLPDTTSIEFIRRNFMIVFTDGLDAIWKNADVREDSLNSCVQKRIAAKCRVFTIGMYDPENEANWTNQDYVLQKLASGSADYYSNVDIDNIQATFTKIQMEIRRDANSLYRLNYLSTKRGGNHTIKFNIANQTTYTKDNKVVTFNASRFESVNYGLYVDPYMSYTGSDNAYGINSDREYSFNSGKIFKTVSYWSDVVPRFTWTSSDTSVFKVETAEFDEFKLVSTGKSGSAIITVTDKANYDYVARGSSATIAPNEASAFRKTFEVALRGDELLISPKDLGYTVTFVTGGGVPVPIPQTIADGKVIQPAIMPEKDGYKFLGWMKDGVLWDWDKKLTENITLTAAWRELPKLELEMEAPSAISGSAATFLASVTGETQGWQFGFFYDNQFGTYGYKRTASCSNKEFTARVTGLSSDQLYFVRAFGIKNGDTILSKEVMFSTRPSVEKYELTGYGVSTSKPFFLDILFSVKDLQGRGVDYLDDEDFILKQGVEITSKTSEFFRYTRKLDAIPFKIKTVLMIDNSSSISYKQINNIKQAAIDLVKSKHEKQEFAIYSFSDNALLASEFTSDVDDLVQRISEIEMGSSCTGLYEAYIKALNKLPAEYITKDSIQKCFLVLLSDGDETKHKYTKALEDSAIQARYYYRNGVRYEKTVYTIGFPVPDLKPARLIALANSSSNYFEAESMDQVAYQFKQIQYSIMREANSYYNLTCLTDMRRKDGELALEVTVSGNQNTNSTNKYSTRYTSCGEAEDDLDIRGTYFNIYQEVDGVSIATLNKYGLGLPDEMSRSKAKDTAHCEELPEDFVLRAVTYGTYVKPKFVWTSSDTSVLDVEGYDFDKARLIYKGKTAETVVITVTDTRNWRAVADDVYGGVIKPRDSGLYQRSIYVRNIPATMPEFTGSTVLPSGTYNLAYSATITASGKSVTFAVASGDTIPKGLTLSSKGVLSGIPTAVGTFKFRVRASNIAGDTVREYTLTVQKAAGAAVNRPTLKKAGGTTIEINAVDAPGNGQTVEYSINTEAEPSSSWQTDVLFSGLEYETRYYIFARAKENEFYHAGQVSNFLSAVTAKEGDSSSVEPEKPLAAPVNPRLARIEKVSSGEEYKVTFKWDGKDDVQIKIFRESLVPEEVAVVFGANNNAYWYADAADTGEVFAWMIRSVKFDVDDDLNAVVYDSTEWKEMDTFTLVEWVAPIQIVLSISFNGETVERFDELSGPARPVFDYMVSGFDELPEGCLIGIGVQTIDIDEYGYYVADGYSYEAKFFLAEPEGQITVPSALSDEILGYAIEIALIDTTNDGRMPIVGCDFWYFVEKGETPVPDTVAVPVFAKPTGTYYDSVLISLSCATPGATILYNLSGGEPNTEYTGSFYLKESAMVTARAEKEGMVSSASVSVFYIIQPSGPGVEVEVEPALAAKIYPNPSKGRFMVEVEEGCAMEVYNMAGACIKRAQLSAGKTPVELHTAGVYIVKLTANGQVATKRVVIK